MCPFFLFFNFPVLLIFKNRMCTDEKKVVFELAPFSHACIALRFRTRAPSFAINSSKLVPKSCTKKTSVSRKDYNWLPDFFFAFVFCCRFLGFSWVFFWVFCVCVFFFFCIFLCVFFLVFFFFCIFLCVSFLCVCLCVCVCVFVFFGIFLLCFFFFVFLGFFFLGFFCVCVCFFVLYFSLCFFLVFFFWYFSLCRQKKKNTRKPGACALTVEMQRLDPRLLLRFLWL